MTEPVWTKSGRCESSSCVEASATDTSVHVRDGKLGQNSAVLTFTKSQWSAFLNEVAAGKFDYPDRPRPTTPASAKTTNPQTRDSPMTPP